MKMNFKFSSQAVGAIMLALQKGIMEQIDITGLLKEFEIVNSADGLMVNNPPIINVPHESTEEEVTKKKTSRKRVTAKKDA